MRKLSEAKRRKFLLNIPTLKRYIFETDIEDTRCKTTCKCPMCKRRNESIDNGFVYNFDNIVYDSIISDIEKAALKKRSMDTYQWMTRPTYTIDVQPDMIYFIKF